MLIVLLSRKGGVGKTTTAAHLATYLQRDRGPTLAIDGDPNRALVEWAERGNMPFDVADVDDVGDRLERYDYVVVDTQAHPTARDIAVLAETADLFILPTTPDALALEATLRTVEDIEPTGVAYRVLLTVCPSPPSKDADEAIAMLSNAGVPTFKHYIRRYVAFQKAALEGVPVTETKDPRRGLGWRDYVQAFREIGL